MGRWLSRRRASPTKEISLCQKGFIAENRSVGNRVLADARTLPRIFASSAITNLKRPLFLHSTSSPLLRFLLPKQKRNGGSYIDSIRALSDAKIQPSLSERICFHVKLFGHRIVGKVKCDMNHAPILHPAH